MSRKKLIASGISHLKKSDPVMKKLINKAGPFAMKIQKAQSIYAALLRAIVYQQLHGKAAETIFNRFQNIFDKNTFPDPARVIKTPDAKLRSAGLSRAKLAAIKDLSKFQKENKIPDIRAASKLSDQALVETLTQVKGIGPWTVDMLMIFKLGRLNIMPVTDYGVRNGFRIAYNKRMLPSPLALKKHSAAWNPYCSIAAWYLWRAADLRKSAK